MRSRLGHAVMEVVPSSPVGNRQVQMSGSHLQYRVVPDLTLFSPFFPKLPEWVLASERVSGKPRSGEPDARAMV